MATAAKFGVDFHKRRRAVLGAVASTAASNGFNVRFRLRPMPTAGLRFAPAEESFERTRNEVAPPSHKCLDMGAFSTRARIAQEVQLFTTEARKLLEVEPAFCQELGKYADEN